MSRHDSHFRLLHQLLLLQYTPKVTQNKHSKENKGTNYEIHWSQTIYIYFSYIVKLCFALHWLHQDFTKYLNNENYIVKAFILIKQKIVKIFVTCYTYLVSNPINKAGQILSEYYDI